MYRAQSGAALADAHEAVVRPWLDLVDRLRAQGIQQDLPLPQIAVVGDQSSGKSSVLEAISGIPFPRGNGLCTRCPTQIIMKHTNSSQRWTASASINWPFPQPHVAGDVHTPEEISSVIQRLTDIIISPEYNTSHTGLSSHSIVIRVSAPNVPDLTLIDLPGIVRTATSGQDRTVVAEVDSLIQSYLQQDQTVILAVVPSNQDVATVDILERAQRVDTDGHRTIGVLTKADLVGPGDEQEVMAVLMNIRKPLRLGYRMVRNLSQAELKQIPLMSEAHSAARLKENEFFKKHPVFSKAPEDLVGVQSLTHTLTSVLVSRIKQTLPAIRWQLETKLDQAQAELQSLGAGAPTQAAEKQHLLMQLVSDFCRLLRQSIRGEYRDQQLVSSPEVRLHALYQQTYRVLQENIASTRPGTDPHFVQDLNMEMITYQGRELPGFLNMQVFFSHIVQNIEAWRPFVSKCRIAICQSTNHAVILLTEMIAPQYPAFCKAMQELVAEHVDRMGDTLYQRIEDMFVREQDPFTANDSLIDVINTIRMKRFEQAMQQAILSVGDKPASLAAARQELVNELGKWYMAMHGVNAQGNAEEMKTLIQAYWNIAQRRLVDNVCMTIEQDFAKTLLQELEAECFIFASRVPASKIDEMFVEDSTVAERRKRLTQTVARLQDALQTIREMAPDCVARDPN